MRIELDNIMVNRVSTLKDKSLKIEIVTREMSPEAKMQVLAASYGDEVDIGIKAIEEDNGKSPSVRMRAVLYRIWEQRGSAGTFEAYYREQAEKIINMLKEKLS